MYPFRFLYMNVYHFVKDSICMLRAIYDALTFYACFRDLFILTKFNSTSPNEAGGKDRRKEGGKEGMKGGKEGGRGCGRENY